MKLRNLACSKRSRIGRIGAPMFILAATVLLATMPMLAGPATTTVSDVVYRADGTPASGTLLISWPTFSTSDGKPVTAGSMSLAIGAGGNVTLALSPNEGASPSGTYYKVVMKLSDGTTSTEYWVVPKRTPVKVSEIRSAIVPATVAVQMASRQYVESGLSEKADDDSVIHKSGDETVVGLKQFSVSPLMPEPTVGAAAATKSYVDSAVASVETNEFIQRTGDAMSGPLTLAGDPTSTNHAANRHYVDLQIAGLTSSVAQKLGRLGDTPITMAGARYASQFPSIQAAVADAGNTGVVIIPSDYTGTESFTNPNNVQILDLRGDASGTSGVYNVRSFGVRPDDNSDDWAAIQAAIDAASAGNGPFGAVYVPKGVYHVSKPLHITRGIKFYGAGRAETIITGFSADQGAVMVVSPSIAAGYTGVPTGPALAAGDGSSMYLNGTFNYHLNFRESGAVELNGRTALTIEFLYKPDFSTDVESYNILSSSGNVTGVDANTSVAIQHSGPDIISAILNIGGVQKRVATPSNAISPGNIYHVAVTFDGSMLRLFINGVLKDSTAASGSIVQKMSEDFTLGPKFASFLEGPMDNPMVKGWVDSIRISNTARYTANFTAPIAKFSSDGNTMFLLNFDNNYDQFTVANTMYGAEHLFLRRFGGGYGQVANFHLSDLALVGTGPEFIYVVSSIIENLEITASRRGLQFINNCYLNRLSSIHVIGHGSTQFALGIGSASGVLTMSDISLTGSHFPFYMDTSSAVISGLWIEMSEGTEIGAVFKGLINGSAVVNHPVISTETAPSTIRYAVAEVGLGSLIMNGGVIETYNSAPHVGVFGGGTLIHTGGNYAGGGTNPASIYQIVSAPTYPVQLVGAIQQGMNVPWADNMAWMQSAQVKSSQSCSGSATVIGIGSTGEILCSATEAEGYTLTLLNAAGNTPLDNATYYFGGNIGTYNNGNFDAAKIEVPKSGIIKRIHIRQSAGAENTASDEPVTHKLCINSGSNCFGSTAFSYNGVSTAGTGITLNEPVAAGDSIAIRVDTPNWNTRPTDVRWYATVYVE